VFQSLGVIGAFMAPLFFLLLSLAALTSTIAAMEVPVSYLIDERQLSRKKAVLLLAAISFIITIPSILSNGYSYFLTNFITYFGATSATSFMIFMSNISGDTLLPLGGFLLSVFVVIAWKKENLHQELSSGNPNYMGSWVQKYVDFSITYIAPVILGGIFILKVLELFFGISFGT
jgi:NSS family neurotransmitter:Na+ symporter